jgi:hypothetical protein
MRVGEGSPPLPHGAASAEASAVELQGEEQPPQYHDSGTEPRAVARGKQPLRQPTVRFLRN